MGVIGKMGQERENLKRNSEREVLGRKNSLNSPTFCPICICMLVLNRRLAWRYSCPRTTIISSSGGPDVMFCTRNGIPRGPGGAEGTS